VHKQAGLLRTLAHLLSLACNYQLGELVLKYRLFLVGKKKTQTKKIYIKLSFKSKKKKKNLKGKRKKKIGNWGGRKFGGG